MQTTQSKSWETARGIAELLGEVPSVFSSTVRNLKNDQQNNQVNNQPSLRPITKYLVCQTFKGKKLLAMFYKSFEQLYPEKLNNTDRITPGFIFSHYQPLDIAGLFGVYYLYRRALQCYSGKPETIRSVIPEFEYDSQIGASIGAAIPAIGIGTGILTGSIQHLATLLLHLQNEKTFELYSTAQNDCDDHQSLEMEFFGCTTVQIGSVLLSLLGFGVQVCELYMQALEQKSAHSITLKSQNENRENPVLFAKMWVTCLRTDLEQPLDQMPGCFYPLSEERKKLIQKTKEVLSGSKHWIHCTPEDISPELTPKLFAKTSETNEVPEQLRDIFSLEEICTMEEEEFDVLLDQIDRNIISQKQFPDDVA